MKKDKKNSEIGLVVQRISETERLRPWADLFVEQSLLAPGVNASQWIQNRAQPGIQFFIVKKPKAKEGFEYEGGFIAFTVTDAQQRLRDELQKWGHGDSLEIPSSCMLVLNLHSKTGFKLALKTLVNGAARVAKASAPSGSSAPLQCCVILIPTLDASSARSLKSMGFENVFTSEKVQVYRADLAEE